MSQSRRMSLAESAANIAVGFGINLGGQMFLYSFFGIHVDLETNLAISLVFTVISFARSYAMRRVFNAINRPRVIARYMREYKEGLQADGTLILKGPLSPEQIEMLSARWKRSAPRLGRFFAFVSPEEEDEYLRWRSTRRQ